MKLQATDSTTATSNRSGATLIEVLMSLMIMSIGVVSVFTLFPLAMVAAVRANQVTNARIYAEEVSEYLAMAPDQVPGVMQWAAESNYPPFAVVKPKTETSGDGDALFVNLTGNWVSTGADEPNWFNGQRAVPDASFNWRRLTSPFIVDPAGAAVHEEGAASLKYFFGHNGDGALFNGGDQFEQNVLRVSPLALFNGEAVIDHRQFRQQNNWTMLANETLESFNPNFNNRTTEFRIRGDYSHFPSIVQMQQIVSSSAYPYRAIFLGAERGEVATGNVIFNGTTLTAYVAPAFTPIKVRIEVLENRYSLLACVHPQKYGRPSVQAAVMYNRALSLESEKAYTYELNDPLVSRDKQYSDSVTVEFGSKRPSYLKEGGYVFDCHTVKFYQIQSIKHLGTGANRSAEIVLADIITQQFAQPGATSVYRSRMIFLPGIVWVKEL